ncbi:MAG: NAD-dependent epimerase/dehydratase family protein [Christensenellales bacterium]
MKELFIVTGACGHLGSTITAALAKGGHTVRAFALPDDPAAALNGISCEMVRGNVLDPASLEPLFDGAEDAKITLFHCAGIVSIGSARKKIVREVNVTGTRNVAEACKAHGARMVYVSSVHAIPELKKGETMTEVSAFDPKKVEGHYAKTKAEATALVLDMCKQGLDAVIIHPSGIIGPNDRAGGHMSQMVVDFLEGRLTAGVVGAYDFVDVRDVAESAILAAEKGRTGECYILSNRQYTVRELLNAAAAASGKKPLRIILPMWLAQVFAPLAELYYKLLRQPPLFTSYSMYTLQSNSSFSHEKAAKELGYSPRPLSETMEDTVSWLREAGLTVKERLPGETRLQRSKRLRRRKRARAQG